MNIKTALILVTIALAHGITAHAHAQKPTKETTKGSCGSCARPSCGGCR